MSYIGSTPVTQTFISGTDYFNGDGTTTAFTLSRRVNSVNDVEAVINNVEQQPNTAYNISGNTITFTSAPSAGTGNIYVRYLTTTSQTMALGPNTVSQGPQYVSINNATALGGATNPILGTSGSANNYVQTYVQNLTNGANSSADFTAYPSNGTDAAGWVDMGMTGPSFSQATYSVTGPNEAYLFGSGVSGSGTGNLVIATDATGSANDIQFYNNGFTKAKSAASMVIKGSGNVGIATTSPADVLDVTRSSNSNSTGGLTLTNSDTSGYGSAISWNLKLNSVAGVWGRINTEAANATSSFMRFYTTTSSSLTEAMRIDSLGNLLVGTNDSANASGNGVKIAGTNSGPYVSVVSPSSSGSNFGIGLYSTGTSSFRFYVNCDGVVHSTSTSISAISDASLKTNVKDLETGLTQVMALKPRRFDWVNGDATNVAGFIAQEVEEVLPELVMDCLYSKDEEGNEIHKKNLKMGDILPTLVKAIQEQQAIITSLQSRIAALEAK